MIDLRNHYGFTRTPFGKDLAPSMLHHYPAHAEAVARLTGGARERALGVVTGEVGSGMEHPEFGGDSILPRSCCLGWGPVPTIRPAGRTAGLVISQFPSLVLSNICPAALS